METVTDFILLGSKITVDSDCSHEIKRHFLLGRKAMINLDSTLKSRNITLLTTVCIVKAMVFLVVMYGCENWTKKKAECQRTDALELWCWRRLWTARRSNQSILKEMHPGLFIVRIDDEAEVSLLWPTDGRADSLGKKKPWCWGRLKAGEGDNRGWGGWMASPTRWTRVSANSRGWWKTRKPGILRSMQSARVRHNWVWATINQSNIIYSITLCK